jgi:hypothetical protein
VLLLRWGRQVGGRCPKEEVAGKAQMFAYCLSMSDRSREHKVEPSYLEEFYTSRCTSVQGFVVALGHMVFLDAVLANGQRKRCRAAAYLMTQREWASSFCASSEGRW